jgi:hypothetical protein
MPSSSSSSADPIPPQNQDGNLPCFITQVDGYTFLLADGSGALWLAACAYGIPSQSTLVQGYLYWGGKRRDTAYIEAVLDLGAPDQYTVEQNGPVQVQLGGTFAGVVIPWQSLDCVDGTVLKVCIGKVPAKTAQLVGKAWYEAMVMRVRATLDIMRTAGPPPPGYPFEVL